MGKRNRFDPSTATLRDALDRFLVAGQNNDQEMKARLFAAFPMMAALDFREVLVRAFGDELAMAVETKLRAAMLPDERR